MYDSPVEENAFYGLLTRCRGGPADSGAEDGAGIGKGLEYGSWYGSWVYADGATER
jgi:hypothetical protein